jgi:basic membrane protein A
MKTYLNDWDNEPKGKEVASSLIAVDKDDVLLQVADTSGHGVIQAAQEGRVYARGVQDQNSLAPRTVLSSFVLNTSKAYDQAVQMTLNNQFRGDVFKPGIESGKSAEGDRIVYLAPFHGLDGSVSPSVKEKIGKLTEAIMNDTLVVPERYGEGD